MNGEWNRSVAARSAGAPPVLAKVGLAVLAAAVAWLGCRESPDASGDHLRDLQSRGVLENAADVVRWGPEPDRYVSWHHHSNRLVPVYTFGTAGAGEGQDLASYTGAASIYRDERRLARLYGRVPDGTVVADADYMDQTDLHALQKAALDAGRRHIFLVVFDGMGWHLTRAAAIHAAGKGDANGGRGSGLHFLDYAASGSTQFATMVTSPATSALTGDVDRQRVRDTGGGLDGGYDPRQGGPQPWIDGSHPFYVIGENFDSAVRHATTESSAAATALCAGAKTYNGAVNVDRDGRRLRTVAHAAQERGYAVGVVTSVTISHATPAGAYAHGVVRYDYQDLTRELVGLPSASHPDDPHPGVDVLLGCGYGEERRRDGRQGANYVPGNRHIAGDDLTAIDVEHGGAYVVSTRAPGVDASSALAAAAERAAATGGRLFGFYGAPDHLPFRTADGDYLPAPDRSRRAESYSAADLLENPTLAEMTAAALRVLERNSRGFWMMVEAGDVDWANHDANIDNAVGAVLSGDAAVRVITDWVERESDWRESLLIVTADHAHYLVLVDPSGLIASPPDSAAVARP